MTRFLPHAVFLAGLAALGWVGAGYVGSHPLALAITALIGAFYAIGALELHRFRQATAMLARAVGGLADPLPGLRPWLDGVPASLQNAVRRRIEGESAGFPGPALAPYLAGLLVLLGMLGTFVGMVFTLRGTGMALDASTDLQAVRASLVAPVQGLGLAFGTSIAGVAASAALGLLSALARRERVQALQQLDAKIATTLRPFSGVHQREESLKLLQRQVEQMPALVDGLHAVMQAMERQAEASNARLLASQERFHGTAEAAFIALASSVDRTLKESLAESARLAGATIRPAVEATMAGIAHETAALHQTLSTTWQSSLDGFAQAFEQRGSALLKTVAQAHAELQSAAATHEQQRLAAMTHRLESMAASLRSEWQQAGAQSLAQQQQVHETLQRSARDIAAQVESQATATTAEIARLLQAAAEAPRAAAEVIGELRRQLSDSIARDNTLLDERARILGTLGSLLDTVQHAATEQRGAIDALVGSSAALLDRVGARFNEQVDAQTDKLAAVAAQVTGSAVEVASLGEAFGLAVELFGQSNDKLVNQLQRIDSALGKSLARSDDQLAYYVAQAREVIDLSLLSQKQIIEDLQRLAGKAAAPAAVAVR
ncbi:hypothetical protein [Rhizobacter sp. SG703]|uniref:hypothetical protein n=1 Tax=Rhizobacter sp. SG703 TaxID=2587140 RepID=UPI001444EAFE|nr:hypothetical protein [Rhizobacter sp. SG703]NKI94297.1 hypothetical protein [Rhizobacter sp. SG703]